MNYLETGMCLLFAITVDLKVIKYFLRNNVNDRPVDYKNNFIDLFK
jgi:hypothetical protein